VLNLCLRRKSFLRQCAPRILSFSNSKYDDMKRFEWRQPAHASQRAITAVAGLAKRDQCRLIAKPISAFAKCALEHDPEKWKPFFG
jgi:hypothetical protein